MTSIHPPLDRDDGIADFYERYCEICRRFGIEPVAPERARELVETWDATLESARATRD